MKVFPIASVATQTKTNKHVPRTGEIAQWIKTLLRKHKQPRSGPQCTHTWLAWQCASVLSAAGRDNWRQEDSWGLPSSQNYQSVAPVLGRDSVSGNKGWLCTDVQPSYPCEHLHTYARTHTWARAHAYATHINTVKKQRRKKVSKCSPLFCPSGRYEVWELLHRRFQLPETQLWALKTDGSNLESGSSKG